MSFVSSSRRMAMDMAAVVAVKEGWMDVPKGQLVLFVFLLV
jgi:hypothetical protein